MASYRYIFTPRSSDRELRGFGEKEKTGPKQIHPG